MDDRYAEFFCLLRKEVERLRPDAQTTVRTAHKEFIHPRAAPAILQAVVKRHNDIADVLPVRGNQPHAPQRGIAQQFAGYSFCLPIVKTNRPGIVRLQLFHHAQQLREMFRACRLISDTHARSSCSRNGNYTDDEDRRMVFCAIDERYRRRIAARRLRKAWAATGPVPFGGLRAPLRSSFKTVALFAVSFFDANSRVSGFV